MLAPPCQRLRAAARARISCQSCRRIGITPIMAIQIREVLRAGQALQDLYLLLRSPEMTAFPDEPERARIQETRSPSLRSMRSSPVARSQAGAAERKNREHLYCCGRAH